MTTWRGDAAAAVRHFERAASCADQRDWVDSGVRCRMDHLLAEMYVAVGRLDEAKRISAWLREVGLRLERPALIGDAARIDALAEAAVGDLDAAADHAQAAVAAHASSPLQLELARSLLVLSQIERRRKPAGSPATPCCERISWPPEMDHRPLLAEIERELPRVAAALRCRADRYRTAGRRPDRGRRDQAGRRGDAVRQRADHRDACRGHLPQAGRAHPGRAGPAAMTQ